MKTSPILPPHPLDHPGVLKILLGKTASETLEAHGDHFMIQATRSMDPTHDGRFVLIALPLPKDALDAATRVALGTHRAVKSKALGGPVAAKRGPI